MKQTPQIVRVGGKQILGEAWHWYCVCVQEKEAEEDPTIPLVWGP